MKKRIGVKGKVGVYGRSIGCTAACRLTPYCELIVADRGFDNLVDLADYKFFGAIAKNLWLYMTGGWQVNNAFNYLFIRKQSHLLDNLSSSQTNPRNRESLKQDQPQMQVIDDVQLAYDTQCYKVILCDKNDEIVDI